MTMRLLVIAFLVSVGCMSSSSTGIERNRGSIQEPDGTYSFYVGAGVGDLLAKGVAISDNHPTAFMRLRAPVAFVEAATGSSQRVKTISFEVPDSSIEATVHKSVNDGTKRLETLYFRPGDPWVTGYAQVGMGPDNFTMGLFEVIKWAKDPSGTMPTALAQQIYSTGLLPDDNMRVLKYAEDPTRVELPENWE